VSTLTVVGTIWNREPDLLRCWAESLLKAHQTVHPDWVVLIDQSTDCALTSYNRHLAEKLGVVYFSIPREKPNMSWAFNVGIKLADTDYIMTTCTDLLYGPNFIATVKDRMTPDSLVLAHCGYLPEGLRWSNYPGLWSELVEVAKQGEVSERLSPGACQCVFREWAVKVHGYDERFPAQDGVDDDFIARARRDGLEVEWIGFEEAQVLHHYHKRSETKGVGSEIFDPGVEEVVVNEKGWGEW
jgi:glycosyltransferase involved in cell wall biosynthesis